MSGTVIKIEAEIMQIITLTNRLSISASSGNSSFYKEINICYSQAVAQNRSDKTD